jgi:hypothetical protein
MARRVPLETAPSSGESIANRFLRGGKLILPDIREVSSFDVVVYSPREVTR